MTTKVESSILVNRPVGIVYNQWTQFEDFPVFMGGVQKVEQLDDANLHWVAEIAGVKRQWNAAILEQLPDMKIAWAATDGATNAGAVYFDPAGSEQTTVRLVLEYDPEGWLANIGDKLGFIERQVKEDLLRFKTFIESEEYSTGAWRGAINPGIDVGTPGARSAVLSEGDKGKAGISGKVVGAVAAAGAAAAGVAAAKSATERVKDAQAKADAEPAKPVHPNNSHDAWIGRTVRDRNGEEVGSVTDIFYDDVTGQPEWLTVATGWFGTKDTFVPIAGTVMTGDDIQVDYDTATIKQAPTRGSENHLDNSEEDRLYAHYGFDATGTDYATRYGDRARADEGYRFYEHRTDGDEVEVVEGTGSPELGRDVNRATGERTRLRQYSSVGGGTEREPERFREISRTRRND